MITESIGEGWQKDLFQLRELEKFVDDQEFLKRWRGTQEQAKGRLGAYIKDTMDIQVDPHSMFDVQVKRLHEYKRQHLNALHILALYCGIKNGTIKDMAPRTFLFGGKAAPSYTMAKLIIKLVCTVGEVVAADPQPRANCCGLFSCRTIPSRWAKRSIPLPTCRSRFQPPARKPAAPVA